MKTSFVFLLSALSLLQVQGKIISKCTLATTLSKSGIPMKELRDWVCLVKAESNFDTKKIFNKNDKSKNWGIFQINDKYWCRPDDGRDSDNGCHLSCETELLADDITRATICAKKIKANKGFKAWDGWQKKCQGKTLPTVKECFSKSTILEIFFRF